MSSIVQSLRASHGAPNAKARFAPVVLLATTAAALLLNILGSPWSESFQAGLIISLLSAIPLAALAYLIVLIHAHGTRLSEQLLDEEIETAPTRLAVRAAQLYDQMRPAREQANRLLRGNASADFAEIHMLSGATQPNESSFVAAMEEYVMQHYVAGEDLNLDAMRSYLNEFSLDRVEPLQKYHEWAFSIGIAGTVLGFGMQIFLGQSSVLSQTFLSGVILKAACTVVGIMVSSYARWLRWQLMEKYDQLMARLMAFASARLSPLFAAVRADRADLAEVLRGVIEDLNVTVGRIKSALEESLAEAVEKASQALGDRLRETFATELADSIKEQITEPFRVEVEQLTTAVARAGDGIAEGVRGLNEGAREFKDEFAGVVKGSLSIGTQLRDASHVLNSLTHKFEEIVTQAEQVARTLQEAEGEVALAIEKNRNSDGNHNNHWMVGELDKAVEGISQERQALEKMLNEVGNWRSRRG